ncbi:MAG TPA: hypothetical protein VL371_13035 [Gemmataceae bacterium]|jgi:hypothetical protein|nr:hypothetical protein [Gemmataceae bacterium]
MAPTNGFERKLAELEQRLCERIKALELQIRDVRMSIGNAQDEKQWWRTIGMFSGDEVMKRIDEAGRKIREAEREKARRAAEREDKRTAARKAVKAAGRKPA